jgi:CDGSH iron-sulfur domain-containing protein 3
MDPQPPIAPKGIVGNLDPGTYYWCACGRSREQPFCDGSHFSTTCVPVEFRVARPSRVTLCVCKQTRSVPYCDQSCTRPPVAAT